MTDDPQIVAAAIDAAVRITKHSGLPVTPLNVASSAAQLLNQLAEEDVIPAAESEGQAPVGVPPLVDWRQIPDQLNHVTVDGDGRLYAWSGRPYFIEKYQEWCGSGADVGYLLNLPGGSFRRGDLPAERSIIARPGFEGDD